MATFRAATGSTSTSTTLTTIQTTLPTGWAAGDIVYSMVGISNITNVASASITSGWTVISAAGTGDAHSTAPAFTTLLAYRVMQAGDTAPTWTWTNAGNKLSWMTIAFTPDSGKVLNHGGLSPNVATTTTTSGAVNSYAAGSDTGVSLVLSTHRATTNQATAITTTPPTNWTEGATSDFSTAAGTTAALRQIGEEACYRLGQTGTISPGALTYSTASTPTTYHAFIKESADTGVLAASIPLPTASIQGTAPLAAYSFNGTGSTVTDQSGNGHGFTIDSNHSRATGKTSEGISGTSGAIGTLSATAFGQTTDRTVMAWIKGAGEVWHVRWQVNSLGSGSWGLATLGGFLQIRARNASTVVAAQVATPFGDGQWHHAAGTYKESTSELKLYLDGTLVNTQTLTGPLRTDADTIDYGEWNVSTTMDDLRIIGAALSQAEIASLMNTPVVGTDGSTTDNGALAASVPLQTTAIPGNVSQTGALAASVPLQTTAISGGSGFSPNGIAGLGPWFRADAITGVSDGTGFESWPDSSGDGHTTEQPFDLKPIYETNEINALPVARFSTGAGDKALRVSADGPGAAATVFVVMRPSDVGSGPRTIWGGDNGSLRLRINDGEIDVVRVGTAILAVGATTLTTNSVYVVAATFSQNDSVSIYLNGALDASATHSQTLTASDYTYLGATGIFGGEAFQGDLAEVLVYDSVLSGANRNAVTDHLIEKYGISAGPGADNGTVAASIPMQTSAITGVVRQTGALAATVPLQTSAVAGTVRQTGAVAASIPMQTAAVAGTVRGVGALAASVPVQAAQLDGAVRATGSASVSVPMQSSGLAGAVTAVGTFQPSIPLQTAANAAVVRDFGALAGSIPLQTSTVTGSVRGTGVLAASVPLQRATLQEDVTATGPVSVAIPLPQTALAGMVRQTGALAGGIPLQNVAVPGLVRDFAALAGLIPLPVGSAVAVVTGSGAVAFAIPMQTLAMAAQALAPSFGSLAASVPMQTIVMGDAPPLILPLGLGAGVEIVWSAAVVAESYWFVATTPDQIWKAG